MDAKPICPTGQTLCGTSCVDLKVDAANCGTCGKACAQGQTCVNGVCVAQTYTGSLVVTIEPAAARAAGAQWGIDNDPEWYASGVKVTKPVGKHTLKFKPVSGYKPPNVQHVPTIMANQTTNESVTFQAINVPMTELITNGDFSKGGSNWLYESWYKQASPADEVNFGQPRVTFKGTSGNTRIGIMQSLNNKDVSGCTSLMLKAVIRADQQTLSGTGSGGREAPVAVFVGYQDANGVERTQNGSLANPVEPQTNQMFWHGFYSMDPSGLSTPARGTKVQQGQWYSYVVDLMTLNPKPKIIYWAGAEGAGWPTRSGALHQISLVCNGDAKPLPITGTPIGQTNTPTTATGGMQPLSPPSDPVIYSNGNIAGVQNGPRNPTSFTITAPHKVTWIYTYHYFNNGKLPGTIALRHSDGTTYGPFKTEGAVGQGNVPNAYWWVKPNVEIKAGSYTVIDSDNATWSHNSGSNYAGFVELRGVKGAISITAPKTIYWVTCTYTHKLGGTVDIPVKCSITTGKTAPATGLFNQQSWPSGHKCSSSTPLTIPRFKVAVKTFGTLDHALAQKIVSDFETSGGRNFGLYVSASTTTSDSCGFFGPTQTLIRFDSGVEAEMRK